MSRRYGMWVVVVLVGVGSTLAWARSAPQAVVEAGAGTAGSGLAAKSKLVAGPGRVEPVSEELAVAAELSGKLIEVLVEEGERVTSGQVLARLEQGESSALLAKTVVRAPIDGVILRRHRRAGESVSLEGAEPAIVTMADIRVLRVRVDVDESDVASLAVGAPAWVTADAYGDRKFTGRVVRIGGMLGRKNIRTDEPSERVDTKILETLIELDPGPSLPIGLRVDAFIEERR
jgi:multidrug efflux pump subunit AcrA (membrane-fusion protein)